MRSELVGPIFGSIYICVLGLSMHSCMYVSNHSLFHNICYVTGHTQIIIYKLNIYIFNYFTILNFKHLDTIEHVHIL